MRKKKKSERSFMDQGRNVKKEEVKKWSRMVRFHCFLRAYQSWRRGRVIGGGRAPVPAGPLHPVEPCAIYALGWKKNIYIYICIVWSSPFLAENIHEYIREDGWGCVCVRREFLMACTVERFISWCNNLIYWGFLQVLWPRFSLGW